MKYFTDLKHDGCSSVFVFQSSPSEPHRIDSPVRDAAYSPHNSQVSAISERIHSLFIIKPFFSHLFSFDCQTFSWVRLTDLCRCFAWSKSGLVYMFIRVVFWLMAYVLSFHPPSWHFHISLQSPKSSSAMLGREVRYVSGPTSPCMVCISCTWLCIRCSETNDLRACATLSLSCFSCSLTLI